MIAKYNFLNYPQLLDENAYKTAKLAQIGSLLLPHGQNSAQPGHTEFPC